MRSCTWLMHTTCSFQISHSTVHHSPPFPASFQFSLCLSFTCPHRVLPLASSSPSSSSSYSSISAASGLLWSQRDTNEWGPQEGLACSATHHLLSLSQSHTHTHTGPASLCPMQAVPPGCHGNLQSVFRGWRPIVLSSRGMDGALGGWSRIAWSACSRLVQTRLTLRLFGCFCYLLLVFLKIFSNYFLQIHIFFVSCCFSVWNGKFPARRRGATSVTNDITRRFFSRASNQRHLETRQAPPPTRNTRHHAGNTKIKHFSSFKVALHEFRKKPFCSSVH